MIRDAAITATGVVFLPAFMTSCRKDRDLIPARGVGSGSQDDPPDLEKAAQNLINMDKWVENVYLYTGNYEQYLFSLLNSGQKPSSWKDFIIGILLDIANGLIDAAGDELPGLGAALAIATDSIKYWSASNHPENLEATFAEFKDAHLAMQKAISDQLIVLADPANNYQALRDGFGDTGLPFNGTTYKVKDLGTMHFPTPDDGQSYVDLRNAGYDKFRKHMWNIMIIKCGTMNESYLNRQSDGVWTPTKYGREKLYNTTAYQSAYLRGYYSTIEGGWYYFTSYYFEFDGKVLSADAAKELFMDDTPGNNINPKGLFPRDYVFKQFHTKKPSFKGTHELRKDETSWGPDTNGPGFGFDVPDQDFVFNGGEFPQLIVP